MAAALLDDDLAAIVDRVRAGDTESFATLYRLHAPVVRRVISDNVRHPEAVADVVQEVFARALEQLANLRDSTRFRAWLLAIARHAAVDHRRRASRMKIDGEEDPAELTAAGPGPDELAELAELAELVQGCVSGLSVRDATAVTMVTYFGFSNSDVAAALGISVGAAKVAVHRARQRLRQALSLQLLVRRRASGCEEFASLCQDGDVVLAGRHAERCEACAIDLRDEVAAFDRRTRLGGMSGDAAHG